MEISLDKMERSEELKGCETIVTIGIFVQVLREVARRGLKFEKTCE